MRRISFSGSLPSILVENTQPGGWAGALSMGFDPALVRFVDVIGSADLYLDSRFDRATGTVSLWNIATPDYDGFAAIGAQPVMHFQIRVFLADGTQGLSEATYALAVGDVDDTPPTDLAFATGGTVSPGVIGATIGTLAVTDVDSAGPFTFTIAEADAWQYEIVGNTLQLRPGMTVAISDGPFRVLNIEVSDGLQSAAHRLEISMVAAPGEQAVLDVLDHWEVRAGFAWKDENTIRALRGGWELERIEFYGDTVMDVVMKDGEHIWLPQVDRLEFLNGTLDMREGGSADYANAAYQTLLGRLADRMAIGPLVKQMDEGSLAIGTLVQILLGSREFAARWGALTNEQFVRLMYRNTEGGVPFEPAVQSWKSALDAGATRASVAQAFATWEVTLKNIDEGHPHGWWLERARGAELAAIYDVALDRLPDGPGFDYWMRELEAGTIGLDNLAILFGRAEEFVSRHAARSTAEFVHELYRTALDRAPDQAGFDFWMNDLEKGLQGRDNMIFEFGFSAEKLGNFAALPAGEPFFG